MYKSAENCYLSYRLQLLSRAPKSMDLLLNILRIFFGNFKFTIVPMEKPKLQFSGNRATVERNGVKFATREQYFNIHGIPVAF